MATTYVDICNSALTRIGLPIISSFNDGTTAANACSNRWAADRDIVLRRHPWSCATVRAALAPSSIKPSFDYPFAFPLPADYLRAVDVSSDPRGSQVPLGARPRYAIESGNILFDSSVLYLKYVNQVANAEQLDPECQNAIALYIAYDLAQLLLNDSSLVKQVNEEFESAMATARNVNAQENPTCMVIDTFERVRFWGPS